MKPAAITANEIAASAKARIRELARKHTLREVAAALETTTEEAYRQCVWAGELPTNVNAHRVPDLQGQYSIPELAARWQIDRARVESIFRTLESSGFPVLRGATGQPTALQLGLETIGLFDGSLTIAELVSTLGVHRSVVYDRIKALKRAGYDARTRATERAKPQPRPVVVCEPEAPPVERLARSAESTKWVASVVRRPTAPHSPATQAILDRLYPRAA